MDNVTFLDVTSMDETTTFAIIDRGNGEYTSMPKSVYDEQQAAQFLTNLPTGDVAVETPVEASVEAPTDAPTDTPTA